jgi:hypothetical protein
VEWTMMMKVEIHLLVWVDSQAKVKEEAHQKKLITKLFMNYWALKKMQPWTKSKRAIES